MTIVIALVTVIAFAGTACASSRDDSTLSTGNGASSDHSDGTVPGTAAGRADATREVVIEASDDLRFNPASIEVETGEVVTLVVRNMAIPTTSSSSATARTRACMRPIWAVALTGWKGSTTPSPSLRARPKN